jgi:hypothetical protein
VTNETVAAMKPRPSAGAAVRPGWGCVWVMGFQDAQGPGSACAVV